MTGVRRASLGHVAAFGPAILALGAFLAIAALVVAGVTAGVDGSVLLALRDPLDAARPLGPAWLQETARDFSGLGSNGVLAASVLAGSGLLALAGRRAEAAVLLASFGGALLIETALKFGFARPRPDLVPHAARVFTASFPSGHATVSAAAGLAAALLSAQAVRRFGFRLAAAVAAAGMIAAIGASRVYLGVHWPTDVLGGWALGLGWTALCWAVLMDRQRRAAPDGGRVR